MSRFGREFTNSPTLQFINYLYTPGMPKKIALFALILCALAAPVFAQSQAINGTIEGTVVDSSGAILPGVTVTVRNTETGAERSVTTNEKGLYRAPLLPLGTYQVVAEL